MSNPYTNGEDVNPFEDSGSTNRHQQQQGNNNRSNPPSPAPAPQQNYDADRQQQQQHQDFYTPPPGQHQATPAFDPTNSGNHQQQQQGPYHTPTQQQQPGSYPTERSSHPPQDPSHQQQQQYAAPQDQQQQQQHAGPAPEARDLENSKCWTVEFYQQFFNVDAKDVLTRMGNTLLPIHPPDFLRNRNWHAQMPSAIENAAPQFSNRQDECMPDAYGPFWLTTTLWIFIAIFGNLLSRIEHNIQKKSGTWANDFTMATVGMGVVYSYWVLMSLCVWGIMKWKAVPAACLDVLCLYGYAMFPFCICAILSAIPNTWWQWGVALVCGLLSGLYLLLNFWQLWKTTMEKPWFIGVVIFVVFFHLLLTLSFKLFFFNF